MMTVVRIFFVTCTPRKMCVSVQSTLKTLPPNSKRFKLSVVMGLSILNPCSEPTSISPFGAIVTS